MSTTRSSGSGKAGNADKPLTLKDQGDAAFKTKDYNTAIYFYSKSIEESPGDKALWANRSLAHYNAGNYDQCEADCRQAIHIEPLFTKSYYRLGNVAVRQGRFSDAKDHYMYASNLANEPQGAEEVKKVEQVEQLLASGVRALDERRISDAVEILTPLGAQVPHGPVVQFPLFDALLCTAEMQTSDEGNAADGAGETAKSTVKSQEVVKKLQTLMELPSFASQLEGKYLLARALYSAAQHDDAQRAFEVVSNMPGGHNYKRTAQLKAKATELVQLMRTASAFVKNGKKYEWARDTYSKALGNIQWLNDNSRRLLLAHRAIVAMHMGDYAAARDDCNAAVEGQEVGEGHWHVSALRCRGYCFECLEDYGRALEDYEAALQLQPDLPNTKERIEQLQQLKPRVKDYYALLGIKRSATMKEVKLAFRKRAQQCHPDKAQTEVERQHNTTQMQHVNEAYAVLGNHVKRARYDAGETPEQIEAQDEAEVYFHMCCGSEPVDANQCQKVVYSAKKCAFFTTACGLVTLTCPCWCPFFYCASKRKDAESNGGRKAQ